jgi:multimeric flavodoxin WrbA
MKIVGILGSPRGLNGNTGLLLKEVLRGAERAGAAATVLSLSDYRVEACRACDACHKTGHCAIADDFSKFHGTMLHADGIVLASPNYIYNVSAQLKAMMDRCCGSIHCLAMSGKYAAAVVTSGSPAFEEVLTCMHRFLRAIGCYSVGGVGVQAARLADEGAKAEAFAQAGELGGRLVKAILAKESFAQQDQELAQARSRMQQLVKLRKDDWPFEYQYWKGRGAFTDG